MIALPLTVELMLVTTTWIAPLPLEAMELTYLETCTPVLDSQPQLPAMGSAAPDWVVSFNAGTARRSSQIRFGYLGARGVILVSGQRHRSQNTDDCDYDHQFNEGKTFLYAFHGRLPF
jgi:hypothetical protein